MKEVAFTSLFPHNNENYHTDHNSSSNYTANDDAQGVACKEKKPLVIKSLTQH